MTQQSSQSAPSGTPTHECSELAELGRAQNFVGNDIGGAPRVQYDPAGGWNLLRGKVLVLGFISHCPACGMNLELTRMQSKCRKTAA